MRRHVPVECQRRYVINVNPPADVVDASKAHTVSPNLRHAYGLRALMTGKAAQYRCTAIYATPYLRFWCVNGPFLRCLGACGTGVGLEVCEPKLM